MVHTNISGWFRSDTENCRIPRWRWRSLNGPPLVCHCKCRKLKIETFLLLPLLVETSSVYSPRSWRKCPTVSFRQFRWQAESLTCMRFWTQEVREVLRGKTREEGGEEAKQHAARGYRTWEGSTVQVRGGLTTTYLVLVLDQMEVEWPFWHILFRHVRALFIRSFSSRCHASTC